MVEIRRSKSYLMSERYDDDDDDDDDDDNGDDDNE